MYTPTAPNAEAPAGVLAMVVSSNGRIDERELRVLDELDAFSRIGVNRDRFVELARSCLQEVGAHLCEHAWLRAADVQYLDRLLDEVHDPAQRLLICRLAAAVITADGRVSTDEQMVYCHVLARWHISQSMVSQAILNDRTH